MPFVFKSKATPDLVMLDAHAKRVLELMGKEPQAKGIVTVEEIPLAIQALQEAVERDEAHWAMVVAQAEDKGEQPPERAEVTLAMRCNPVLKSLRTALDAQCPWMWGV